MIQKRKMKEKNVMNDVAYKELNLQCQKKLTMSKCSHGLNRHRNKIFKEEINCLGRNN